MFYQVNKNEAYKHNNRNVFLDRKIFVAEFLGTSALLVSIKFLILLEQSNFTFGITIGLVLLTLIHLFGPISGAHFNPLITLGFVLNGNLKGKVFILSSYIFPQFLSSFLILFYVNFTDMPQQYFNLWDPNLSNPTAELIGTFCLLLGIFELSENGKLCPETKPFTGIAVGCLLASILIVISPFGRFIGNPVLLLIGIYGYFPADWLLIIVVNIIGGIIAYCAHRVLN